MGLGRCRTQSGQRRRPCCPVVCLSVLALALGMGGLQQAPAAEEARPPLPPASQAFKRAQAKVAHAVVSIYTNKARAGQAGPLSGAEARAAASISLAEKELPRDMARHPGRADGCGILITQDGHILTAHIVIGSAREMEVRLATGRRLRARCIGVDAKSGTAVLKVDGADLPTALLGDSNTVKVGDWVLAVSHTGQIQRGAKAGIVTRRGRAAIPSDQQQLIQTSIILHPSDTGGPLVNQRGRVVGINLVACAQSVGGLHGSFAIPINAAKFVYRRSVRRAR